MSQEAPFPQIEYMEFNITLDMSTFSKEVTKNSSLMLKIQKDPLKALNDLKNGVYSDDYINYQNEKGWTILHYLCRNARNIPYAYDLIEFLLNLPIIDVNSKNINTYTPLMMAACYSKIDSTEKTVEMLLQHQNIKLNLFSEERWTALMLAARHTNTTSSEKTVEILLQYKDIDVNFQNDYGWTALMLAAGHSNTDATPNTVKMLLQHPEIKINLQNNDGWSALILTCYQNLDPNRLCEQTIEMLLQHPDINPNIIPHHGKKTALMHICAKAFDETIASIERIIKLFIQHPNFDDNLHLQTIFNFNKWTLKQIYSLLDKNFDS